MSVPSGALNYVKPTTTVFELEALEGLPCGCVAAAYRARPWDVAVVSLEAKGPHCILTGHASGQILRLGDPSEFEDEETDTRGFGMYNSKAIIISFRGTVGKQNWLTNLDYCPVHHDNMLCIFVFIF